MWSATWQLSNLRKAARPLVCVHNCALAHALHWSLSGAQRGPRCGRERAACGKAWHAAGWIQVPLAPYKTSLMAFPFRADTTDHIHSSRSLRRGRT